MGVDWKPEAARLAAEVAGPVSRWRGPVASTPRHLFVPRWWRYLDPDGWTLRDGSADERRWMRAAYSDRSLVTRIGAQHADHASPGDHPAGRPTSSSTMPGLVVRMYRHAQLGDGADILDVGTGSGYGCALVARRLGEQHVTSIDIDPYLTEAAVKRLDQAGLHPLVVTGDATGPLPGSYDRIVSMVSVKPVPASWLAALRPGGRLVTVLAGTTLLITAAKTVDGGAQGRVEWDRAGFMATRAGPDYPPGLEEFLSAVEQAEGDQILNGRYPVLPLEECWELRSMLEITAPGIACRYREGDDGTRTAWMAHPDGSWARATAHGTDPPLVHQTGPRRLWDILDEVRDYWLSHGEFPLYGAQVTIPPDGSAIHLQRGRWQATIT